MPKVKEILIYSFDELSQEAKEKAVDNYNSTNEWHDLNSTIDFAKEFCKVLGFDVNQIYYRICYSQGDHATLEEYSYSFKKGALKDIKKMYPKFDKLHTIAKRLNALGKITGFKFDAYKKGRVDSIFGFDSNYIDNTERKDYKDIALEYEEILNDIGRIIFNMLCEQYEYAQSFEYVSEILIANDYEFDLEGNLL